MVKLYFIKAYMQKSICHFKWFSLFAMDGFYKTKCFDAKEISKTKFWAGDDSSNGVHSLHISGPDLLPIS